MIRKLYPLALSGLLVVAASCKDGDSKELDTETETETEGEDGGVDAGDGDPDTETDSADTEDTTALLIDDFEDGDGTSLIGGGWFAYSDSGSKGASSVEVSEDDEGNLIADAEGYESDWALKIGYTLDQGDYEYDPYVGWGVTLGEKTAPFDASGYSGITYAYKGDAHTVSVLIFDVTDYDNYNVSLPASDDWTVVSLLFSDFAQGGWGTPVSFNLDNVQSLGWQAKGSTGDTGSVYLDDVGFLGEGAEEDKTPDLTVNESDPPEDEVLDSVEIDSSLQKLAMASLDKGYNITNWLEQAKFDAYSYDEDTVKDLAANGFKSLRLPIDLDLYIADRDEYFAGEAEFAIEDLLFEILDNFEKWTADAGMSFTIDYHQYDGSFDMSDPLYVDAVIKLWTAVAEHFADNSRQDLFFEIMNEPELAGDVSSVDQSEWTEFAEKIIAGIRSEDTSRVILFGDVSWNAISSLVERTPFEDDKIIYLFHFYEPFLFTHQGASWSSLGTVHDIPYPYSTDRWSEYSSDFGISSGIESWLLSQLHSYYTIGNKSWLRNKIVEVKSWAVKNQVPVLCNEFGVYDRTSLKEDRVRYYTDLIDIFEELEIPWQIWFMIMDDDGTVDEDLKTAFGLE